MTSCHSSLTEALLLNIYNLTVPQRALHDVKCRNHTRAKQKNVNYSSVTDRGNFSGANMNSSIETVFYVQNTKQRDFLSPLFTAIFVRYRNESVTCFFVCLFIHNGISLNDPRLVMIVPRMSLRTSYVFLLCFSL